MNVLLGVTGSVAAIRTPEIVTALRAHGHDVSIVATTPSLYFWKPDTVIASVWRDEHEWAGAAYARDQPILHIDLRRWADALVIAPCSANTLAKLAAGLCDNLLTSVCRAWDRAKPIVIAPAMNTAMWEHPATAEHLATIRRWYPTLRIVHPVERRLACGDTGIGALAPPDAIADAVTTLCSGT